VNAPVGISTETRGLLLFDRPFPEGYREELAALVAEAPKAAPRRSGSLLLFGLGGLRLALPTRVAWAIAPALHIARIPHRSGTVLLGLAGFRGEILPCCSLARLLDIDQAPTGKARTLILEEAPGRRWAVPIDDVLGVRLSEHEPEPGDVPFARHFVRGNLHDGDGSYHLLDHDVLFRQITLATA
jgi:chemotaxis-related protein WspD